MNLVMKQFAIFVASALLTAGAGAQSNTGGTNPDDLPDIGSPAQAMLTLQDEYQIGRMVVRLYGDRKSVV